MIAGFTETGGGQLSARLPLGRGGAAWYLCGGANACPNYGGVCAAPQRQDTAFRYNATKPRGHRRVPSALHDAQRSVVGFGLRLHLALEKEERLPRERTDGPSKGASHTGRPRHSQILERAAHVAEEAEANARGGDLVCDGGGQAFLYREDALLSHDAAHGLGTDRRMCLGGPGPGFRADGRQRAWSAFR